MKISPVLISNFMLDGGAMFGVIPKMLWSKKYPADENNMINMSLRSLIVDNGDRVILIDTGYGDKLGEKFLKHAYINGGDGLVSGVKKAGYQPGQITDILLTHLHADHCGGTVSKKDDEDGFELTFPGADIWVSRRQYEWAAKSNVREAGAFMEENILPMMDSGRLRFIDEEGEIFKGIEVKIVNGHTPGQLIPFIDYKDTKLIYTADLIPTSAHIPILWNMSYDLDQLVTIDEKTAILNEAFEKDYILFFEHDYYVECCSLKETPRGIREDQILKLGEI